MAENNGDTRHAAGGKMVGEFKEIDPHRHDQDTDRDIQPFLQGNLLLFGHATPLSSKTQPFPTINHYTIIHRKSEGSESNFPS